MIRLRLEQIALIGKMPTFPEYLRVGATDPLVSAFDIWLAQGMDKLMSQRHEQWHAQYATGAVHGFVFHSHSADRKRLLVGAVGPSSDTAGRTFPLAVAAPVECAPELVQWPELLPLLLEPFWLEASEVLLEAPRHTRPSFEARARAMSPAIDNDGAATTSSYQSWLADLPIHEMWALLFPPSTCPPDSLHPDRTLRMLAECARPIRGTERPKTPLTLRLALGQAGGAAVCFWLDVTRRLAGWRETIPSFFWAHDGTSGTMLLHMGEPPTSTLSELWTHDRSHDEFCDLTQPVPDSTVQWLAELPPALNQACLGSDASVLDVLRLLGGPSA
jgi:type VI secretion system ImpM family protein